MGVMFPLLAGCRLVFTAVIMVDITVVKYPVSVKGGMQPFVSVVAALCCWCICRGY